MKKSLRMSFHILYCTNTMYLSMVQLLSLKIKYPNQTNLLLAGNHLLQHYNNKINNNYYNKNPHNQIIIKLSSQLQLQQLIINNSCSHFKSSNLLVDIVQVQLTALQQPKIKLIISSIKIPLPLKDYKSLHLINRKWDSHTIITIIMLKMLMIDLKETDKKDIKDWRRKKS